VIDLGVNGLRAIAISLPWWGAWSVSAGALRGSGDTRSPMVRGVIAVWLSVLLGWIGVRFFDQSVAYVWGVFFVTLPIAVIGNLRAFHRRAVKMELEDPDDFAVPATSYHP
jgi:Na+-driven multidrug efflux pump